MKPLYIALEDEDSGSIAHKRIKPPGWWARLRARLAPLGWLLLGLGLFLAGWGLRGCVGG